MAIQDSGSNYQFYDKKIRPNVQRSSFQLDYLSTFTANQGVLIPYRIQETLPNSEYDLSLECLSRAINVPKVILQSRQRVFFHEYHVSYQQMWPEWSTFMSKGVSGKVVKLLPKIRFCLSGFYIRYRLGTEFGVSSSQALTDIDTPAFRNSVLNYFGLGFGSLSDYLGFPTPQTFYTYLDDVFAALKQDFSSFSSYSSIEKVYCDFNAFPFFAYFSIYRNFYLNWNLNSNDKDYFPDNVNDFALVDPDVASNIWFSDWDSARSFNDSSFSDWSSLSFLARLNIGKLKYRNFVDDYFTSSLPWPMRGNVPELEFSGNASFDKLPVGLFVDGKNLGPAEVKGSFSQNRYFSSAYEDGTFILKTGSFDGAPANIGAIGTDFSSIPLNSLGSSAMASLVVSGETSISFVSGFTWEMIRNLSTATIIAEKMARTNGSYKEFIQTFFDDVPSNQVNNVPRYVGGSFQPIVYTEVLQTSADANTPLGTPGAKGISSSDDYIGKVYSNDFGVILGILSIMPDSYYSQGLRRQNFYEVQEDFYLPERAELGMQGVLKGELFFTGNDAQDNALFGYQNRYDEWRYRANEIHGEVANPNNKSYFPYTQSRYFTGAPVLGNTFVTTKNNIRRDYLTSLKEVDFLIQVANKCTAVQPLPYRAIPVGLKD